MKNPILPGLLLAFSFASCQQNSADNPSVPSISTVQAQSKHMEEQTSKQSHRQTPAYWEKLQMYQSRDQNGTLILELPLPVAWQVQRTASPGDPFIVGPRNTRIWSFPAQSFVYSNDWNMQRIYTQAGQRMRPFPGTDQVIRQDVIAWAGQQGMTLKSYKELPSITQIDKWYSDQLYKVGPVEQHFAAIGIELAKADGSPYFLLMHLTVSNNTGFQQWFYLCQGLQSDRDYYEQARKHFVFSLENTRYAMEPIAEYNRREIQKAGQSWAAFQQRMRANWANFEAQQRAHVNKTEAVNNAIMGSYNARMASSDRTHAQTIDTIRGETNAVNTATGQTYKVEAGYNHYWMNSDGQYLSTDHSDYDPNQDDAVNRANWQQLQEIRR